jgi:hypothetical protein
MPISRMSAGGPSSRTSVRRRAVGQVACSTSAIEPAATANCRDRPSSTASMLKNGRGIAASIARPMAVS